MKFPRTLKEMDELSQAHGPCDWCHAKKGEPCMAKIQWGHQFGVQADGVTPKVVIHTFAAHAHAVRIQAWMRYMRASTANDE